MQNQLEKAISLVKKTGDRIIVVNGANTDDIFVVISLDEYEKLTIGKSEVRGLTEDELLDKINRDIAIWKSEQKNDNWEVKKFTAPRIESEDDDLYYYNEIPEFKKFKEEDDYFDEDEDCEFCEEENFFLKPKRHRLEEIEKYSFPDGKEAVKQNSKNQWQIPTNIKRGAEEILEKF
ncbi:MAG: hypothetical protein PHT51_01375 [Patescibacteria group bacterium]|nr:hypothetical protein [Patescibacteria group bacterium]MDD4610523.1 hypothetical protein [Patescibacteria group bacterium]